MEQHAIPQQISSYEFKLVGDMTLKQFLKAAAGIVIAVAINATGLIFFLKYPLMLIFGAGGLMIAFVPFQDRPLETWVIAFLRSIYSPTIYTYKKMPDKDWISLMSAKSSGDKKIVSEEDGEVETPIKNRDRVKEFIESLPSVQAGNQQEQNDELKITNYELKEENKIKEKEESEESQKSKVKSQENETKEEDWRDKKAGLNLQSEKLGATGKAVFGAIPMPDKPEVPNIIVGMVTTGEDRIVEGAIIEIQDEKGNPSRVIKTNSLGQFKTTTPLANGKYLVITEKEGLDFDRVNIEMIGKIVEPIKIKAKI